MSQIRNEQTKRLVTALNAAASCFTVGVATPIAGYLDTVSNRQASLAFGTLLVGGFAWIATAVTLHLTARQILKGVLP